VVSVLSKARSRQSRNPSQPRRNLKIAFLRRLKNLIIGFAFRHGFRFEVTLGKDDQYGHIGYASGMRKVNIGDLKAHLSDHIQLVKDGEELLVCDRNKPVARIVPCRLADVPQQERRLVARGVLTPPLEQRPARRMAAPPGDVSDEVIEQVWQEEREGR
jgi:prevent-host-death family protein